MPSDDAPLVPRTAALDAVDLDRLASRLQVGVLVQGENAEVLFANARAHELLGLTPDELGQRTSFDPAWTTVHGNGEPFPPEEHPPVVALRTGEPVADVVMGIFRPRRGG